MSSSETVFFIAHISYSEFSLSCVYLHFTSLATACTHRQYKLKRCSKKNVANKADRVRFEGTTCRKM